VTVGGDFCLDLVTGGTLEVWAAPPHWRMLGRGALPPLAGRRHASQSSGVLSMPGGAAPPTASFTVRDVWAGVNLWPFQCVLLCPGGVPRGGLADPHSQLVKTTCDSACQKGDTPILQRPGSVWIRFQCQWNACGARARARPSSSARL